MTTQHTLSKVFTLDTNIFQSSEISHSRIGATNLSHSSRKVYQKNGHSQCKSRITLSESLASPTPSLPHLVSRYHTIVQPVRGLVHPPRAPHRFPLHHLVAQYRSTVLRLRTLRSQLWIPQIGNNNDYCLRGVLVHGVEPAFNRGCGRRAKGVEIDDSRGVFTVFLWFMVVVHVVLIGLEITGLSFLIDGTRRTWVFWILVVTVVAWVAGREEEEGSLTLA